MPNRLKVTLRYSGPDVDDGTMPVADVLSALGGFAGAYGKIAARYSPELEHRLRVSAVESRSFELVVWAWAILGQASGPLQTLQLLRNASRWVVAAIAKLIQVKKHIRGQPHTVHVTGDSNTVVIVNFEGSRLEMCPEIYEIFSTRMIDSDLKKIARPLQPDRINRADLIAADEEASIEAEITSADQQYFDIEESATTVSREANIDGHFVSLNKEHNRGTFRLFNGVSVPYQYCGSDPYAFHREFSYRGPVRVRCVASFDQNLAPSKLDITEVERLQRDLPLQATSNSDIPPT